MLVVDLSSTQDGARLGISASITDFSTTASKNIDLDHSRAFAVPPGWYDLDLCVGLYALGGD